MVNFRTISFCSYQLKKFDVVMLNYNVFLMMKNNLKRKLYIKLVLSYFPRYLLVSYKLMCGFFIRDPVFSSIPFPFKINLKTYINIGEYWRNFCLIKITLLFNKNLPLHARVY